MTATATARTWQGQSGGTTYGLAKQVTLHAVRVLELLGLGLERGCHRRRGLGHPEPRPRLPSPT